MATYRYRAISPAGELKLGETDAASPAAALERVRAIGLTPLQAQAVDGRPAAKGRVDAASRRDLGNVVGELAVLLGAGLPLDRALALTAETARRPALKASLLELLAKVKEGVPLSRAMAAQPALWPPLACAMAEAGEADGRQARSMTRLGEALDRAEALRQTLSSSMVYPAMLLALSTGVILLMLLFVVPQFEGSFGQDTAALPASTQAVLGISRFVSEWGWATLLALTLAGVAGWQAARAPQARLGIDRAVLRAPRLGPLVQAAETARFARVLGSLIDGGVTLPAALGIARGTLSNTHMAAAVGRVAVGLKEGGGLSRPLAQTGVFPPLALGFLRTGEETAQLGTMLVRLADILDRDVRNAVQTLLALFTPVVTIVLGVVVAGIVASLMSAILGFNNAALPS